MAEWCPGGTGRVICNGRVPGTWSRAGAATILCRGEAEGGSQARWVQRVQRIIDEDVIVGVSMARRTKSTSPAVQTSVKDLAGVLHDIAPLSFAESWDNVGLLVGAERDPVTRVLLTIDLTETVLDEAIAFGADIVIAYHPPIFHALKSLADRDTLGSTTERIVLRAVQAGIAIYTPHTALDAAPGGVNDWIAGQLGSGDVQALVPQPVLPETEQCKVVTFAPAESIDRIREALSTVGAGRIGEYHLCSFELRGTGTFFGSEASNPAVGERGILERVDEVRLEMVCPSAALALAVMTLREFHPYEEPPIEIYALEARPQRNIGQGRRVVLDQGVSLRTLARRVKTALGISRVRVATPPQPSEKIRTIGLCAGSGGSMLTTAMQRGCEAFITGEMRHHDVLAAMAGGCAVIIAGHTNTERGYLPRLQERIGGRLSGLEIRISDVDRDPLEPM